MGVADDKLALSSIGSTPTGCHENDSAETLGPGIWRRSCANSGWDWVFLNRKWLASWTLRRSCSTDEFQSTSAASANHLYGSCLRMRAPRVSTWKTSSTTRSTYQPNFPETPFIPAAPLDPLHIAPSSQVRVALPCFAIRSANLIIRSAWDS